MNIRAYKKNIFISSQVSSTDIPELIRLLGVRVVVNNRPDKEEISQPLASDIEQSCRTYGVYYYHIPMNTRDDIGSSKKEQRDAILKLHHEETVLFFCRTGARSESLLSA